MTVREQNAYDGLQRLINELVEEARWAARRWVDDCFASGDCFVGTEAYRSQEEQNEKILQGRWTEKDFWDDVKAGLMTTATAVKGIELLRKRGGRGGSKVTYTLYSNHAKRLAIDIMPLSGGYQNLAAFDRIAAVAQRYGITHPYGWDKPHFEFDKAKREPKYTAAALLRRAARLVKAAPDGIKQMLMRRLERAKARKSRLDADSKDSRAHLSEG